MPCTGNCNQGRACDCEADIDIADDNSPGESMVLGVIYGLVAWLAIAAFAFVVTP